MGSNGRMTEYERRRLENIKRNDQILAALKIHSRLDDLSAAAKRQSRAQSKSYKRSPVKKPKSESHLVLRRSLRSRGVPPDTTITRGLYDNINDKKPIKKTRDLNSNRKPPWGQGPLTMRDAYTSGDGLEQNLLGILSRLEKSMLDKVPCDPTDNLEKSKDIETSRARQGFLGAIIVEALQLKPENMGSDGRMTEYVERRLENIKRNNQMLAALKIHSRLNDLSTADRQRTQSKSYKWSPVKKPTAEKRLCGGVVNVEALQLRAENIERLVQGRITSLKFYPTLNMQMVVVGNKYGGIGFWNINGKEDDGDGIYLFHPHPGSISGIVIDPFSISKIYTSCYDGFIRLMDVQREVFDMVYSGEHNIYSISLGAHDEKSLYFGEGKGKVNMWDVRAGKSLLSCNLHEDRINTIDFKPTNGHVMATSSKDGTACIWDLRRIAADKPTPLKTVCHKNAVNSAYFSPNGKYVATTSIDDRVGLLSGANYDSISMVYHYNQTDRCISTFRGIWGWDDSSIYIGNMNRGVDVISIRGKKLVATLESGLMSDIPCRFDVHPYNVGMLAGATSGGQVYVWTPS
ncbi:hypothetical protein OROHE_022636 [Orobanche hederae]